MKLTYLTPVLVVIMTAALACSPADEVVESEPQPQPVPTAEAAEPVESAPAPPPVLSLPPQPPGPAPRVVSALAPPRFGKPMEGEGINLVRARAQWAAVDGRSPIVNGHFERWLVEGPEHWSGNFTYKKPGDPPDMDIKMFSKTIEGEWALRFMPKGTYIEVYQDVKLPESEGDIALEAIAYARNPVPEGFAIRMVYAVDGETQVAEIYPSETDGKWTRFAARIQLPAEIDRESVRLYLTRDASVREDVIVDAVSVWTIGGTGVPGQR